MNLVLEYLGAYIIASTIVLIWHKLENKSNPFKNYKYYIISLILGIISVINFTFMSNYLRMVIIFFAMIACCKILFKNTLKKTIITVLFTELIIIISECIYVVIISLLLKLNLKHLMNYFSGTFITDLSVSIISILLFKVKIVKKIYKKLQIITSNIKIYQLLLWGVLLISSLSYIYFVTYYSPNLLFTLIFNFVMCIVYIIIIIITIYNKNKYNLMYEKYNNSVNDLVAYEKLVENYRITMHEDKNTLKTIQGMTTNKKIIGYIETLLKQKYFDNKEINSKITNIPSGGLKGLLHSKISTIQEKGFNLKLIIDKKIKYNDFGYIDDNLMIKICKIIGVYIDNAIEELETVDNPQIKIHIYKQNDSIIFSIINNYITKVDYSKLGHKRISSKGNNHGYGLILANKIINEESLLKNKTNISKNTFEQQLIIKRA